MLRQEVCTKLEDGMAAISVIHITEVGLWCSPRLTAINHILADVTI